MTERCTSRCRHRAVLQAGAGGAEPDALLMILDVPRPVDLRRSPPTPISQTQHPGRRVRLQGHRKPNVGNLRALTRDELQAKTMRGLAKREVSTKKGGKAKGGRK